MNRIITCTKRYVEIPFAHRQPDHKGACRYVHGHGWTFEFTFACDRPDECGFVVDFGKLKFLKHWIDQSFDHKLVLSATDPLLASISQRLQDWQIHNVIVVPDCSAEGLARYLLLRVNELLEKEIRDRSVKCIKTVVFEDSRNSATCEPKDSIPS